jgi:hypothetical protein
MHRTCTTYVLLYCTAAEQHYRHSITDITDEQLEHTFK